MSQSRRSFLGLISAVSAAVAAGIRVPASTEAAAAGTAPAVQPMSDDEAEVLELPPQTASADRQERQIRELLGQCYMVGLEKQCSLDGPSRWIAEYRKQPREGRVRLKPNFDKLKPVSVEMNHSVECIDDGISRDGKRRVRAGESNVWIKVTWQ